MTKEFLLFGGNFPGPGMRDRCRAAGGTGKKVRTPRFAHGYGGKRFDRSKINIIKFKPIFRPAANRPMGNNLWGGDRSRSLACRTGVVNIDALSGSGYDAQRSSRHAMPTRVFRSPIPPNRHETGPHAIHASNLKHLREKE